MAFTNRHLLIQPSTLVNISVSFTSLCLSRRTPKYVRGFRLVFKIPERELENVWTKHFNIFLKATSGVPTEECFLYSPS